MAGPLSSLGGGTPYAPGDQQLPEWTGQRRQGVLPGGVEMGDGGPQPTQGSDGGLAALEQALTQAQISLEDASAGVPRDRLLDDFRQRVLQWAPSHTEYRKAREAQRIAAQRMLEYYNESQPFDDREAWMRFAIGALSPTRTGSFGEGMANAMSGYTDAYSKARERYLNQRAKGAELGYNVARDETESTRRVMTDSLTGLSRIAALERIGQLVNKPGAMSDAEKRVRAMGYDPKTPEGKAAMLRLIYTQHGTPEIKETIAEYPELVPGTAEFAAAMAKRIEQKRRTGEARISASEAAASAAAARAAQSEAELQRERERGNEIRPDPNLAESLGTVVAPVDPYAPLSGKAKETAFAAAQKQYDKENEDLNERAIKARAFGDDGKRALELLIAPDPQNPGKMRPRVTTGGVLAIPGVSAIAGAFHPVYSELNAIQKRIAPQLRVAGSGAMSDFDARVLLASTFGPDKPFESNVNLAMGYIAASKRVQDYQDARERYFTANKTTQGFDQLWRRYVESNRLLSEGKGGILVFNKDIPNFSTWIKTLRRSATTPRPGGPKAVSGAEEGI